jgi:hypothetical protein
MNFKETYQNAFANLSRKHLKHYTFTHKLKIIFVTFLISFKSLLASTLLSILFIHPPKNDYETERWLFKKWFCLIWATEVLKR